MAKLRFNIQIDESTKDYLQEQADRLGVSISGFVNVIIAQHRQQQESLKVMGNMDLFTKMLEEMKSISGQANLQQRDTET